MARAPALLVLLSAAALFATAAEASPGTWRLTPDGYGPARIGMSRAQVAKSLGSPLKGEAIEDEDQCIEMVARRGYPGLVFMFRDRKLSRIAAVEPGLAETPRGIGVGAGADAVRRAYGPRLEAEAHHYLGLPAEYLTYWTRPGQRGVRFETDAERRVQSIIAGDDSIRYVEGCA